MATGDTHCVNWFGHAHAAKFVGVNFFHHRLSLRSLLGTWVEILKVSLVVILSDGTGLLKQLIFEVFVTKC